MNESAVTQVSHTQQNIKTADMDHRPHSKKSKSSHRGAREHQASEKRQTFKKRKDFQRAVVATAKESIKP